MTDSSRMTAPSIQAQHLLRWHVEPDGDVSDSYLVANAHVVRRSNDGTKYICSLTDHDPNDALCLAAVNAVLAQRLKQSLTGE